MWLDLGISYLILGLIVVFIFSQEILDSSKNSFDSFLLTAWIIVFWPIFLFAVLKK